MVAFLDRSYKPIFSLFSISLRSSPTISASQPPSTVASAPQTKTRTQIDFRGVERGVSSKRLAYQPFPPPHPFPLPSPEATPTVQARARKERCRNLGCGVMDRFSACIAKLPRSLSVWRTNNDPGGRGVSSRVSRTPGYRAATRHVS